MKIVRVSCLAGLLACGVAQAEDSGFYVGASFGEASQEANEFDASDETFRLFGGWSFNKYFAVEGGYIDAGTQADSIDEFDVEVSSDGFFVYGLAKLPIGDMFAPYVKLGYVFYDTTEKVSLGSLSESASESDADLIYGIGFELNTSGKLRFRAEYEEVNLPDSAFDIISVAVTYQF